MSLSDFEESNEEFKPFTYKFYHNKELDGTVIKRYKKHGLSYVEYLKDIWTEGDEKQLVSFSDLARYSFIKQDLEGLECICFKYKMSRNLRFKSYLPTSFVINSSTLAKDLETFNHRNCNWFLKKSKSLSYGGKEVVCLQPYNIKEKIIRIIEQEKQGSFYVLQKSIEHPLLIDDFKVDFRFYGMLVFTKNQLNFYTYDTSLIRFSLNRFNHTKTDPSIQLTNTTHAKHLLTPEILEQQTELLDKSHYCYRYMKSFELISSDVIKTVHGNLNLGKNYGFVILGFDFIITSSGFVYLLEINRKPAIYDPEDPYRVIIHKNLEHRLIPDIISCAIMPLNNKVLLNKDDGGWKFQYAITF